jgi:hypothetical protein
MNKTATAPPEEKTAVQQNGKSQPEPIRIELLPSSLPPEESPLPVPPTEPAETGWGEKAVCLALSLRKPGNSRKLSASLVEVDADKELISAQKTLLSSEHLKTIEHYDGEIRRYLYSHCLPSLFKDGVYLVPLALIEEVEQKLNAFADNRQKLVAAFLEVYPALIEDAKTRLRAAFNPNDYPPAERLEKLFRMEWRYVAFSVPGTLRTVSKELFKKEQEKAANAWAETLEEVRTLLRTHMAELVGHMVDRLSGTDDKGKPKVFKNTLVSNMTEFLNSFDARNLTDDAELAQIVGKARQLLSGVDAQTLRTSQALRSSLRDGFCALQGSLDTLITVRPSRAFSFTEE